MPPVVAAVASFAAAVFVPTVIAGSLGTTVALGLAQIGAGLLVNEVASALMPNRSARQLTTSRMRQVSISEPVTPSETAYGFVRKGGAIVFLHETGAGEFLHLVIVFAKHSVAAIEDIYFDGEQAFDASGSPVGRFAGFADVEKVLGHQVGGTFPLLQTSAPEKWTSAHNLTGCAAIHLRLRFNAEIYPNGVPGITALVRGKDTIYDPRTGTSGYSNNAALCTADYMRETLGVEIGAEDGLNTLALIEAANICDEPVPRQAGGTEPRYTIDGVIGDDFTPEEIVAEMATAMAGNVIYRGADFHIHAGAYRTPTVTLTENDIDSGGLQMTTKISRAQNFNGVRGEFVSPENDWQPDDAPAYQSAAYLAEDGGEPVWFDMSLPFTTSASAAQRIFKIVLEKNRRQQTLQISGKLSAWRAVTGETVLLDYARWGFDGKPFDVNSVELGFEDGALRPTLALRETSPLVYDWDASEEQIYAAAPRTSLPTGLSVGPPGQPELSSQLYVTRDAAATRALLRASWAPSASPFVERYQVEARRVTGLFGLPTGEDWVSQGRTDQTFWEIRDVGLGLWEVRVKAISVLGVSSAYAENSLSVIGLGEQPNPINGLSLQTAGGLAVLKWNAITDVDVKIGGNVEIRHSTAGVPSWTNATSMDSVPGTSAIAVVPLKPGAYLVRAVDSEGVLGPVVQVATKGAQALSFANITTLAAHPTWSGVGSNVETSGSSLTLTDVALGEGTYEFATTMDLGQVRLARVRSDIVMSGVSLSLTIDERTDLIDDWLDFDGTDGAEIDVVVEGRFTDDDPAASPVWSDWSRIDSSEDEFRGAQFRARLTTGSTDFNVLVEEITITADEVSP